MTLKKRAASVFDSSEVTTFKVPHSNTILATFSRAFATSFTELPEAMNPNMSIEGKKLTTGLVFATSPKIPLIYIKSIGEIGDPCGIPVSTSLSLLSCLSITSCTFQSVKNELVHVTRSPSITSSIMRERGSYNP